MLKEFVSEAAPPSLMLFPHARLRDIIPVLDSNALANAKAPFSEILLLSIY